MNAGGAMVSTLRRRLQAPALDPERSGPGMHFSIENSNVLLNMRTSTSTVSVAWPQSSFVGGNS